MKVLVTGGRGFLGRHVVAALQHAGHEVVLLARPGAAMEPMDGLALKQADLLTGEGLPDAVQGVDAVIHLAFDMGAVRSQMEAVALDGTRHLVAAMAGSGARLILASSFSVYDWAQVTKPLTEDSPLLTEQTAPLYGDYATVKWLQECLAREACRDAGLPLSVLRPAMIWGAQHLALDGLGLRRGRWCWVFNPVRLMHLTAVENCAQAFVTALSSTAAADVFNIEDGHQVSAIKFARLTQRGARCLGVPAFLPLLVRCLRPLAHAMLKRGRRVPGLLVHDRLSARFPLVPVDNSRTRQAFAWVPSHSFEQVLARLPDHP